MHSLSDIHFHASGTSVVPAESRAFELTVNLDCIWSGFTCDITVSWCPRRAETVGNCSRTGTCSKHRPEHIQETAADAS